jgi:surface antigen
MKIKLACLMGSILLGLTATAVAGNYAFLGESPIRYFNAQDWAMLSAAQQKALDKTPDNVKVSWKNPKKNHQGYFIPENTTHKNGVTCRLLQIFSDAGGLKSLLHFEYCKIKGKWKIVR